MCSYFWRRWYRGPIYEKKTLKVITTGNNIINVLVYRLFFFSNADINNYQYASIIILWAIVLLQAWPFEILFLYKQTKDFFFLILFVCISNSTLSDCLFYYIYLSRKIHLVELVVASNIVYGIIMMLYVRFPDMSQTRLWRKWYAMFIW